MAFQQTDEIFFVWNIILLCIFLLQVLWLNLRMSNSINNSSKVCLNSYWVWLFYLEVFSLCSLIAMLCVFFSFRSYYFEYSFKLLRWKKKWHTHCNYLEKRKSFPIMIILLTIFFLRTTDEKIVLRKLHLFLLHHHINKSAWHWKTIIQTY